MLKKELIKHLRSRRTLRRTRHATNKGQARGRIVDAVSIKDRPAEVEDRAVPGHWEGDLLCGLSNTHIATLVERKSRYTMLVRVAGGDTRSVVKALSRKVRQLPIELRKSLTWDRGSEMAHHKRLTVATNVAVYFVIRNVRGSAARMKIQTDCCANFCRAAPIYPNTRKENSTPSHCC